MIVIARCGGNNPRAEPVPAGWTVGAECGIPSTARGYGQSRNWLTAPDGRSHIVRWSGDSRAPRLADALAALSVQE